LNTDRKVTVFGGAKPQPGDAAYLEAQRLGGLLANAGCTVLTGGYGGTMEATSRGAAEAGGHVIGVTCMEIENSLPLKANQWVKEEWKNNSLSERVQTLCSACTAAIALPGGVGTMVEITMLWNQIVIHAIPQKPMIAVGNGWKSTFDQFYSTLGSYVSNEDRRWLIFADTVELAAQYIQDYYRR
jgi:hypothetical protein